MDVVREAAIDESADPEWSRTVVRASVLTLTVLVSLLAALLAVRRLVGALHRPLGPATLMVGGLLLAIAGWSCGELWRATGWRIERPWLRWVFLGIPCLSLLAVTCALSLPNSSRAGLIVFWGGLLAGELLAWRNLGHRLQGLSRAGLGPIPEPKKPLTLPSPPKRGRGFWDRFLAPVDGKGARPRWLHHARRALTDDVMQQLTRRRNAEGREVISGALRADFMAGQQFAAVHVAFCPPFSRIPKVKIAHVSGPEATLKLVQCHAHGARVDARLELAAPQPVSVLMEFRAEEELTSGTTDGE